MVFSYKWRIPVIIFLSILIPHFVNAQITFQNTYGSANLERAQSVQQCTDGGYIITGYTTIFGTDSSDVYLIRTDEEGELSWSKTYGGLNFDRGHSVQQTSDGGFVITGYTQSFGAGFSSVYVIRVDNNGVLIWTKVFGGLDFDLFNSVQQTTDGGFIMVGHTSSFGAGLNDVYLIRINADGAVIWDKTFGGTDFDVGSSVQQTTDGGFIITGHTLSFVAEGFRNINLIRTDTSGDLMWAKTYAGSGDDWGTQVQQTTDGGFIITGYAITIGEAEVSLIRTDADGELLWSKAYGGMGDDRGHSVQQTLDGGFIITGLTRSFGAGGKDMYLIRTDENGDQKWSRTYGGTADDLGFSVQETTDSGFIIVGFTRSFGLGSDDVFLIKTDANGNTNCNPVSVNSTVQSDFYRSYTDTAILSGFGGSIFPPGTIELNPETDICFQCDTIQAAFGYSDSLLIVNFNNLSSQKATSWNWDFGDGATSEFQNPTHAYASEGSYNVCLSVFDPCSTTDTMCKIVTVSPNFQLPSDSISIYPNPNNGEFTLELVLNIKSDLLINVYRISGQLIFSEKINDIDGAYSRQIDISDQYGGIYYAQIITVRGVLVSKIVYQ